jgi:hypothetical protein
MSEPALIRRLEAKPDLWDWAHHLGLLSFGRLTHKGRVWFRWLTRQLEKLELEAAP